MGKLFKRIGIVVGSIIGLLLIALGIIYIVSNAKLNTAYAITAESIPIPTDSASIAQGEHLVKAISKCGDCHGENLGGKVFIDDPMIGTLITPNLTSGKGGIAKAFTDQDWVRAIRYGVSKEGKGLKIMPADEYWHNSDGELGAIIAYVKSVPPVDNEARESTIGPLGRVLYVFGVLPLLPIEKIDLKAKRAVPPPAASTMEYGKHLVTVSGCAGCHNKSLSGGKIPGTPPDWPPAANLTPGPDGLGSYSEADFFRALREGVKKNGAQMNSQYMPWKATAQMKDEEIKAVWTYLRTVQAKKTGEE